MAMSIRAAPEGSRLPCSQLRRVLSPIPSRPAKASWVRLRDRRTLETSLLASHAFLHWRGFGQHVPAALHDGRGGRVRVDRMGVVLAFERPTPAGTVKPHLEAVR